MIDTYTKAVLTVIALALVLLTVENLTYQARAQQVACGDYIHPCVVTTENPAESPHVVTSMLERQAMTANSTQRYGKRELSDGHHRNE